MALKISVQRLFAVKQYVRTFSNETKLTSVAVNDKTGIATLTMQSPPVNSLNLELLTELSNTLTELENNKCRGMILTSSSKSVFSAGLDIMEMYKPKPDRVKSFWSTLQDTWIKLYGSSYPTVAVINGHSPAGGCLLAMSCEYRIMLNNFTIGLNETQLGIVAPKWFIDTLKNTISNRQSELALTLGRLFKTDEALQIGLIDDIAASKEEGIKKAEDFLTKFVRIPPIARALTKKSCREQELKDMIKNREADLNTFIGYVGQDKVQKSLEFYLESLKKKASK